MKTKDLKETVGLWLEKLSEEEKAENTIRQYARSLEIFADFAEREEAEEIDKKLILSFKNEMLEALEENQKSPKPGRRQLKSISTVNARLIALNKFLKESGEPELRVKLLKDETSNTLDDILTEKEYQRILKWADRLGKEKIRLIIETLAGTGIRISELRAITVESLKKRTAVVTNKGKTRTIFIPKRLAKKLRAYCKKNEIESGIIFHGRDKDTLLDQAFIRKEMKKIAGKARGIKKDKVHAHAFRHLFAKRYAQMPGANAFILPMLLGHSDKTQGVTALYVKPSTRELLKEVDKLEAYYSNSNQKGKKNK